jgi:hypothetical protein
MSREGLQAFYYVLISLRERVQRADLHFREALAQAKAEGMAIEDIDAALAKAVAQRELMRDSDW